MENRFRDLRKTLTEELRNEKTGEELSVAVERGLLDFYNDEDEMKTIRKKFKTSRYEHGIAIGVEKDKTIWLYDNRNKTRHAVESVADVAPYLFTYWRFYIFKMSI